MVLRIPLRAVAAAVTLLATGMLLLDFSSNVSWRVPARLSRVPCVLRPGSVTEFFVSQPQDRWVGIGFEHLPGSPPAMELAVFRVPDGGRLAYTRVRARGNVLLARFPTLTLSPGETVKVRLTVGSPGQPVYLQCEQEATGGVTRERPVAHTYHMLGTTPGSSFTRWFEHRVVPLLPPGAGAITLLALALTPVVLAIAVWATLSSGRADPSY